MYRHAINKSHLTTTFALTLTGSSSGTLSSATFATTTSSRLVQLQLQHLRWRTAVTRTARNLARRVSRRVSVSRMVLFHTRCVCVCKLSLWTMRASRNLACLVGRTQASEFLFSTRKLGPKFKMGSPPLCEYTFSSSSSSSSSSSDSVT